MRSSLQASPGYFLTHIGYRPDCAAAADAAGLRAPPVLLKPGWRLPPPAGMQYPGCGRHRRLLVFPAAGLPAAGGDALWRQHRGRHPPWQPGHARPAPRRRRPLPGDTVVSAEAVSISSHGASRPAYRPRHLPRARSGSHTVVPTRSPSPSSAALVVGTGQVGGLESRPTGGIRQSSPSLGNCAQRRPLGRTSAFFERRRPAAFGAGHLLVGTGAATGWSAMASHPRCRGRRQLRRLAEQGTDGGADRPPNLLELQGSSSWLPIA